MKKEKMRYNLVSVIFAAMFVVVVFTITSAVFANALPVVTNQDAKPGSIPADGITKFVLNVTVTDDIAVDTVVINLNSVGGDATTVMQRLNGNNTYSNETTAAVGTEPGTYYLNVNATDINDNYNDAVGITLMVTATTATTGDININEIMYNPAGTESWYEWIELYNNDTVPINFSGWTIKGKIITTDKIMDPESYVVLARNKTAFENRYGTSPCSIVEVGWWPTLSNEGSTIILKNATGAEIDNVTYEPIVAENYTLELNATGGWEESLTDGGTPCEVNSIVEVGEKGDFDGDGDVDFDDFVEFAGAYGATSCADPNYNSIADFDNDCNVDFDDFVEFAGVYTG